MGRRNKQESQEDLRSLSPNQKNTCFAIQGLKPKQSMLRKLSRGNFTKENLAKNVSGVTEVHAASAAPRT